MSNGVPVHMKLKPFPTAKLSRNLFVAIFVVVCRSLIAPWLVLFPRKIDKNIIK